jgi:hypothetical protein
MSSAAMVLLLPDDDWMWLAASIADQVCASIPKDVYSAFREALSKAQPAPARRR